MVKNPCASIENGFKLFRLAGQHKLTVVVHSSSQQLHERLKSWVETLFTTHTILSIAQTQRDILCKLDYDSSGSRSQHGTSECSQPKEIFLCIFFHAAELILLTPSTQTCADNLLLFSTWMKLISSFVDRPTVLSTVWDRRRRLWRSAAAFDACLEHSKFIMSSIQLADRGCVVAVRQRESLLNESVFESAYPVLDGDVTWKLKNSIYFSLFEFMHSVEFDDDVSLPVHIKRRVVRISCWIWPLHFGCGWERELMMMSDFVARVTWWGWNHAWIRPLRVKFKSIDKWTQISQREVSDKQSISSCRV